MGIEECCVDTVTDIPSNRDRDESLLLGVVSSTSEQQSSKENHGNKFKEVSSLFNLDSLVSLDLGTHASIPQSMTSNISLGITDKSNLIDREHLDHYYDSDETYISNTIHSDVTDENIRKIDWKKKTCLSHDQFLINFEALGMTFGITSFCLLYNVKHSSDKRTNISHCPFRTATYKCGLCLRISASSRQPKWGVMIRYNCSIRNPLICVKVVSFPLNNIHHQSSYNQHDNKQGIIIIKKEEELTEKEYQYIINESPNRTSLPRIRMHRTRVFGSGRMYSTNLLNRVSKKGRDQYLGLDQDAMLKLFQHCKLVKKDGGLFRPRYCHLSLKLTGYSLQTALELACAKVYGTKLFYMDSTHNCTRHHLKICPPSGIDCFWFSVGFGLTTFDAEASEDVKICLIDLSLNNKGAMGGVDRAPSWDAPFALFEIIQIHDTLHFGVDIRRCGGGLVINFRIM